MKNYFYFILLFFFSLSCADAPKQQSDKSVVSGAKDLKSELKVPYESFSKGYRSLNAELISSSYTQDGILINVYHDAEPKSYQGRQRIQNFFTETIGRAKKENLKLKITFKVLDRQLLKETVLDNGFYKLEIIDQNNISSQRYGKFSIVLRKESNSWKFFVDTNASANEEEYQNAKSI